MLITQNEATAAQRTISIYAVDATDGVTPETGLTPTVQVSKNGAAFAAGAGTVAEVASGVYTYELTAAEVDTLGALIVRVTDAAMRTVVQEHQVIAADLYTTVPAAVWDVAAASHATANTFGALVGTIDDIDTAVDNLGDDEGLKNRFVDMGVLDANESTAGFGMEDAADITITMTGDFDGSTVTVETCADPTASPQVWLAYDDGSGPNPRTAAGTVTVQGPVRAVRCTMSSAGASSSVTCSAAVRAYRA